MSYSPTVSIVFPERTVWEASRDNYLRLLRLLLAVEGFTLRAALWSSVEFYETVAPSNFTLRTRGPVQSLMTGTWREEPTLSTLTLRFAGLELNYSSEGTCPVSVRPVLRFADASPATHAGSVAWVEIEMAMGSNPPPTLTTLSQLVRSFAAAPRAPDLPSYPADRELRAIDLE